MTIFELVKAVLDELYEQGSVAYGVKLDDVIRERITYLSREYRQLVTEGRQPISYKDPATRFAYVFMYVAAHSDYLLQILAKLQAALNGPIFERDLATVSCVGGGPGSDIIGLLKLLDESSVEVNIEKIRFYLLDGEQGWADTWTEIDEKFETHVAINANFQPLDVTKPDSFAAQTKFLKADLFTMVYFFSEVYGLDEEKEVIEFWARLFGEAKKGALFVYIDNGSPAFNEAIDDLIEEAGLEVLREETDIRITPSYTEQKDAIQKYMDKFAYSPKLQSQISYRLLRK